MGNPVSAPTARVLDVLELLSQPGAEALRFSDVAREVGLSQGTANAILGTLTERGWVERDPVDKRYRLGGGLALLAVRAQTGRTLANQATEAARQLAEETGMLVNLAERVGDEIAILAYEGGSPGGLRGSPGDTIPYAPPFGLTFAAWDDADGQRAWRERASLTPAVIEALDGLLDFTRHRGYSVEWMTEVMAEVAEVFPALGNARSGTVSKVMRRVMDGLLLDYIGPESQHFKTAPDPSTPVIVISAPVFDQHGRVAYGLTLHPLRPLEPAEIERLGARLTEVCGGLVPAGSAQSTGMS